MSKKIECDLDYSEIDEVDEISGDEQLVLIWCHAHGRYENHWIDIEYTGEADRRREKVVKKAAQKKAARGTT